MSITLYGAGSSRSFRCLWALHETDLDYSYVNLKMGSTQENSNQSPQYLKHNPQGKVPCLVHDEFVLNESAAILNYIDSLSSSQFIPSGAQPRAQYDALCFFILSELEQPLWTVGKHRFALPEEVRVKEIFPTAQWEFNKAMTALTDSWNLDQFALGEHFSFADILLAHTLNWARRFEFTVPSECLEYRDRMYARSACSKAALDKIA